MPSFSIEAEGAAVPLNHDNILRTLELARGGGAGANSAQKNMVIGAQQLRNWETHAGFYSLLQEVYLVSSLPSDLRLLALIQLKNGIDSHWRKTSPKALPKEEKTHIKNHALEAGVQEPQANLAKFNGLILAKIARYEFPNEWPTLISELLDHLRRAAEPSANPQYMTSTLTTLLPIVKELSTGRLMKMRSSLQQVAPEVIQVLGRIYGNIVQQWASFPTDQLGGHNLRGEALQLLQRSLLALKILRRLIIAGYEHPNKDKDVEGFWSFTQNQFSQLYPMVGDALAEHDPIKSLKLSHLRQFAKFHVDMARTHPAAFVLLPHFPDLLDAYMNLIVELGNRFGSPELQQNAKIGTDGDAKESKPSFEILGLKGLLVFRACLKMAFNPAQTFKFQRPEDKEERGRAVDLIKTSIFTDEFVFRMMEILVTKYFVFNEEELRNWEDEPEEWEKREEEIADAWEFSFRSCAEKLFLDLVINFKALLVPGLLGVFKQYASVDNQDVLLKESLYSAIGLAAPCLEDALDFNDFLKSTLVQEISIQRPRYNLLRRRIAILLGQWVPIKPAELDRKIVYAIFQSLFDSSNQLNDQVVRVTAGRQLRNVLDPFEFQFEDFEPYATFLLSSLMKLISEVELPETKMAILETVRVAVVKLERKLLPYADTLMSLLPPLWDQSQDEHLMKQAILTMITAIINALGPDSLKYHSLIIPLIRNSLEPESESLIYLLEEALDLLLAIIQQTPTEAASSELLSLSASIIPILELGTDSLRQALEICDSFTLLSPSTMLSTTICPKVLPIFTNFLPTISSTTQARNQIAQISTVLESLVRSTSLDSFDDQQVQRNVYTRFLQILVSSSLLTKILAALQESYTYTLDPRPARKPPSISGVTETDFYTVLARLTIPFPDLFAEAINAATPPPLPSPPHTNDQQQQTSPAMTFLLPAWFLHFDSIADINRKKLSALALTSLIASKSTRELMRPHFSSILSLWTDIVTELSDSSDPGSVNPLDGDYLAIYSSSIVQPQPGEGAQRDGSGWGDTAEDERRRQRSKRDPVFTVNIRGGVAEAVRGLIVDEGGEEAFKERWLGGVDEVVVRGFAGLGLL
ncbi:MAG: hypothetical protein Q9160_004153 [Pyrenula sp. 1 TL-2023]